MKKLAILIIAIFLAINSFSQSYKSFYYIADSTTNLGRNIPAKNLIYLESDSSWYFLNHLAQDTNKMSEIITWGWAYKVSGPSDPILELWLREGNHLSPINEDDTIYAKQLVLNGLSEDESPDSVISIVEGVLKTAALEEIPNYWTRELYGEGVYQIYPTEGTDFLKVPYLLMEPAGGFSGTINWGYPNYPQTILGVQSNVFSIANIGVIENNTTEFGFDTVSYGLNIGSTSLLGGSQYLNGSETFRVEGKNSVFNPVTRSQIEMYADSLEQSIGFSIQQNDPNFNKIITFDSTGFYPSGGITNLGTSTAPWDTIYPNNLYFPNENEGHIGWDYDNDNKYDVKIYSNNVNSLTFEVNGNESYSFQPLYFINSKASAFVRTQGVTQNYNSTNQWYSAITIISDSTSRESHINMTTTSTWDNIPSSKEIIFDSTGLHRGVANPSVNIGTSALPFDTTWANKVITSDTMGIVIKSANGTSYRIRVSNTGVLSAQPL